MAATCFRRPAGEALAPGVIVVLALVNLVGPRLVERSEGVFNLVKLAILALFIVAGLLSPSLTLEPLGPAHWVGPGDVVSVGMLVFLSYEGFELIANASDRIRLPERTLPVAYYGSVLTAILLYVLMVVVTQGHLPFAEIAKTRELRAGRRRSRSSSAVSASRFWASVLSSPPPRRSMRTCSVPPSCR